MSSLVLHSKSANVAFADTKLFQANKLTMKRRVVKKHTLPMKQWPMNFFLKILAVHLGSI